MRARHLSAFQEAPRRQGLSTSAAPHGAPEDAPAAGAARWTPQAIPWAELRADQVTSGAGPRRQGAPEAGARLEAPERGTSRARGLWRHDSKPGSRGQEQGHSGDRRGARLVEKRCNVKGDSEPPRDWMRNVLERRRGIQALSQTVALVRWRLSRAFSCTSLLEHSLCRIEDGFCVSASAFLSSFYLTRQGWRESSTA